MTLYIYLAIGFFLLVAFLFLNYYKLKLYTKEDYEYEEEDVSLIGLLIAILIAWPIVILFGFLSLITKYISKILP